MSIRQLTAKRLIGLATNWYPGIAIAVGLLMSVLSIAYVRGQTVATENTWKSTIETVLRETQARIDTRTAESVADRKQLHENDENYAKASAIRFESLSIGLAQVTGTVNQIDKNVTLLLQQRTQALLRDNNLPAWEPTCGTSQRTLVLDMLTGEVSIR